MEKNKKETGYNSFTKQRFARKHCDKLEIPSINKKLIKDNDYQITTLEKTINSINSILSKHIQKGKTIYIENFGLFKKSKTKKRYSFKFDKCVHDLLNNKINIGKNEIEDNDVNEIYKKRMEYIRKETNKLIKKYKEKSIE